MNKSRLDLLWHRFEGVSVLNTPSEVPSDKVLLSESAIRLLITASLYGMVRLEYIQNPSNPDTMQLIGYDSVGQIITSVDIDKGIVNIVYRPITLVDIDNGVDADLNTPALELIYIGKTEIIPLVGTSLKGSTTNTIQTDVVSDTIKSNLLIDSGNNNISSVLLKTGNNGVYSKLNIDNSTSITLKETNDGLSAVLHLINSNEELKFESITWEEYNILENKLNNTVYFISNKSAIFFNGQEYSILIDLEVINSKFEEIKQELEQIVENVSGGLKSVTLNGNELTFVYTTVDGDTTVSVDLSKYIDVYTPGNGISITGNEISVSSDIINKIDNNSNNLTQILKDIQNVIKPVCTIDGILLDGLLVGEYITFVSDPDIAEENEDVHLFIDHIPPEDFKNILNPVIRLLVQESYIHLKLPKVDYLAEENTSGIITREKIGDRYYEIALTTSIIEDKLILGLYITRLAGNNVDITTKTEDIKVHLGTIRLLEFITQESEPKFPILSTSIYTEDGSKYTTVTYPLYNTNSSIGRIYPTIFYIPFILEDRLGSLKIDIRSTGRASYMSIYGTASWSTLSSDSIEDIGSYETIEGAASKYQPKGNYLTEHQDISGLATKQEVADAVAGVDVTEQLKDYAKKSELPSVDGLISKDEADATYQPIGDYLTEHQDISNLATKEEVSGKVDKVSGKGLSTNDYTAADKAKVDTMSSVPLGGSKGLILSWESTGKAKWDDLTNVLPGIKELLAYGVEWDINVGDPHLTRIGNMSLHKTLPIQSLLKGCIALGGKIIYWLDENDWRRRIPAERIVIPSSGFKLPVYALDNFLVSTNFSINVGLQLLFWNEDESYIKSADSRYLESFAVFEVTEVSSSVDGYKGVNGIWKKGEPAYDDIFGEDNLGLSGVSIEIGSNLSGYDGTVRVFCPEFYIKSEIDGDKRRVWITTVKIDDTWTCQPSILIDAYRSTVLNTVPENMGYLSTLPVNSTISVVNTATYCRGGNNASTYDQYLETDPCRTGLGKPRTGLNRATMRLYAKNVRNYIMSYDLYKNIMYWLYVVEYANFNSQEAFNSALTDEGYHQGGMGLGVANISGNYLSYYNNSAPLTPCGYLNEIGNGSGIKAMTFVTPTVSEGEPTHSYTVQVPRWRGFDNPFGDIWTNLDGIIIDADADNHPNNMNYVYTCKDPDKFGETLTEDWEKIGEEIHQDSYTKLFDLGDAAHIIPKVTGGDTTTYKCDYHWAGSKSLILRSLIVGGDASYGLKNGLSNFYSLGGVTSSWVYVGFRSVSTFVSFPTVP